ncbi:unnamed protein product [Spirodela intermedia]|uniref:Uncharacterized protein n=1 Tax=Spirodela intermedia TaxID=51605 RepID=A0A7I8JJY0_SPIIN|nr:unnamed protein product [Spirodela intermedia]CAA6670476.1 unnamed protein product [Spirodela intermedia]
MAVAVAVAVAAASARRRNPLPCSLPVRSGSLLGTAGEGHEQLVPALRGHDSPKARRFTLGIASAPQTEFVFNRTMLSPADRRLALSSVGAKLAVFRPKSTRSPSSPSATTMGLILSSGWYMVAFAGRKYAARSPRSLLETHFHHNQLHLGEALMLLQFESSCMIQVLEFEKGRLQNLFWKRNGCSRCSSSSSQSRVCLGSLGCGTPGPLQDIQLAFSGTDKHYTPQFWYEVSAPAVLPLRPLLQP